MKINTTTVLGRGHQSGRKKEEDDRTHGKEKAKRSKLTRQQCESQKNSELTEIVNICLEKEKKLMMCHVLRG